MGLGSTTVVAGVVKSPGTRVTVTGTVTDCNFGALNVTVKAFSAGTSREHGVLQPGPIEVTASTPGGTDSSLIVTGVGADLKPSMEKEAQPLSIAPEATTRNTRRMTWPAPINTAPAAWPHCNLKSDGSVAQWRKHPS
jgi:hypothetical protein